jgi:hypothetical protein
MTNVYRYYTNQYSIRRGWGAGGVVSGDKGGGRVRTRQRRARVCVFCTFPTSYVSCLLRDTSMLSVSMKLNNLTSIPRARDTHFYRLSYLGTQKPFPEQRYPASHALEA